LVFDYSLSAAAPVEPAAGREISAAPVAEGELTAIRLDGELNESVWENAQPVSAFLQRDPLEGAPSTLRTEARVAYDKSAIYVAVRAFDPEPDRITAFLTRRDDRSSSDWIRVLIDSYHDRRTAYEFSVNPLGVKQDSYWFNDSSSDGSWDAVWDVVVRRDPEGWRAEFRIPFSQLRFSRNSDGRLGFAVVREVARLNETSTWPLLAKSASGYVSSFGEVTGIEANQSKRLEVVPYTVAQVATEPKEAGNPLQHATDPGGSAGVDVKYAITPALTLTATVNPDFGQVEADPATVNLTAFETFFEEKRPFFVEGSGTYRFDLSCNDGRCTGLFYSRRIGRAPRGEPDLPDGGYAAGPHQSTILGAGKLTGRIGQFSVGALAAATQEETARVAIGSLRRREVVEPRTFYSIARARREFPDQSSLGFMLTSTNRSIVDSVSFLPDTAVTGGVDYDWRFGRRFSVNGYWAGSSVRGSTDAITALQKNGVHTFQRPDAAHVALDPLATTLGGHAGNVAFNKIAGERTRFSFTANYRTPGFEINDLGYLRRADEISQFGWVQWRSDTPGRFKRTYRLNFNQWSSRNFDGDRLGLGGNINMHWTFQNFWSTGFGVNMNAPGFDDRLTRGGPGGDGNSYFGSWQYMNTNDRRAVSFSWNSFVGGDRYGTYYREVSPRIALRPMSALSAELGIRYTQNADDAQWIKSVTDTRKHYVFGRLAQKTSAMTARLNYALTPNVSLQLYGEPFVSTGHYQSYRELMNGRAVAYADRYAPFAYDDNADFNYLSFRTTNVLRWEFKPGSTVFVVWQQGREYEGSRGDFRFGRDYHDIFATPASNTLLVKFAYWLNP
jgi:hypothetical protein